MRSIIGRFLRGPGGTKPVYEVYTVIGRFLRGPGGTKPVYEVYNRQVSKGSRRH